MPAVDKLLLEEALQDSPQVPPAAPVPLAGEQRPRRPLQPLGAGEACAGPPAGEEGAGAALLPEPATAQNGHPSSRADEPQGSQGPCGWSLGVVTPFQTQLKLRLPA